ncbi:MAG: hypothetical protein V2B15_19630 [Bacteroidota bacterium]
MASKKINLLVLFYILVILSLCGSIGLMKNLEYKGYAGTIGYSKEDGLLYGKVLGIQGLISYEGTTGKELKDDFMAAVDSYLAGCKQESARKAGECASREGLLRESNQGFTSRQSEIIWHGIQAELNSQSEQHLDLS